MRSTSRIICTSNNDGGNGDDDNDDWGHFVSTFKVRNPIMNDTNQIGADCICPCSKHIIRINYTAVLMHHFQVLLQVCVGQQ